MLDCFQKNTYHNAVVTFFDGIISSNLHVDILKYGFNDAFDISKYKLSSLLGEGLIVKGINGEKIAWQ